VSTPARPAAPYRVGQQVAVPRDGALTVGTIRGAQRIGTAWRYRIVFSPTWWEWVEEGAIQGVQGELPLDGGGPRE
jgi:hypothetical protein